MTSQKRMIDLFDSNSEGGFSSPLLPAAALILEPGQAKVGEGFSSFPPQLQFIPVQSGFLLKGTGWSAGVFRH
jgi:hypothetical protein